jgi:hypothetical protein
MVMNQVGGIRDLNLVFHLNSFIKCHRGELNARGRLTGPTPEYRESTRITPERRLSTCTVFHARESQS